MRESKLYDLHEQQATVYQNCFIQSMILGNTCITLVIYRLCTSFCTQVVSQTTSLRKDMYMTESVLNCADDSVSKCISQQRCSS